MWIVCWEVRLSLWMTWVLFLGWSPMLDAFISISARLRASIASKADVTIYEVEEFLNLRQNISQEANQKLLHPKIPYSDQEVKHIDEMQSISRELNHIRVSPPAIPVKQKRTPAKRKQSEDSEKLDKLIIKMTKKRSTTKDIVSAAKKKFPFQDINDSVIRSRKSRLRKSDKLV